MKNKFFSYILIAASFYYTTHTAIIEYIWPDLFLQDRIIMVSIDIILIIVGIYCLNFELNKVIKYIFWSFLLFSTLTYLHNMYEVDLLSHLNGLRDTLVLFSIVLILRSILSSEYSTIFIKNFTRYVFIIALIQIPISIYQFIIYGPSDYVGGSMGYGGSGLLTLLAFLWTYYLLVIYGSHKSYESFKVYSVIIISILLLPTFINETKITFVFLPIFFILIMNFRKNIVRTVSTIYIGLFLFVTLASYYQDYVQEDPLDFTDENFLNGYLFDTNEYSGDISRIGRVIILYDILKSSNTDLLLGKGYGLFKGQNILGQTKSGRNLTYLTTGSRNFIFEALLQGGLIYLIIIIALLVYLLVRMKTHNVSNMKGYKLMIIFILSASLFYNSSLFYGSYIIFFVYFISWTNNIDKDQIQSDGIGKIMKLIK